MIRYAEYEIALESLRKVRVKLMGGAGGSKRTLADYCILRRVNFVFERATRKFRGDLSLWVRWLDFCTASKSSKHISRVSNPVSSSLRLSEPSMPPPMVCPLPTPPFHRRHAPASGIPVLSFIPPQILAQALKLHPAVPGLWARAAAWEFDHKRDSSAARKLLQRGLRMCPSSQQLWIEFFRFELLYAAQLRARRSVLGLGEDGMSLLRERARSAEGLQEGYRDIRGVMNVVRRGRVEQCG